MLRFSSSPNVAATAACGPEQNLTEGQYGDQSDRVLMGMWKCCRSPNYWDRAQEFDPHRFPLDQPVPNEVTNNFAYLPFGGGRRKCIGAPSTSHIHMILNDMDSCLVLSDPDSMEVEN